LTTEKYQVSMPILTDARCTQMYGASLFNSSIQTCAGETTVNAGACQGDSGGPLVIQSPSDSNWYLVGLIRQVFLSQTI